ncbi:hypothetical protein MMOR_44040 [Mycolicibacterium moriokaense]|uniref:Major facilitator superfamily (MFS) profile domain-containing protein n=1 Tax=Mycolicibacterium moriokaense TaxID=39691 RepID=A0AAD1M7W5_9MYCO|nr:MFS transporter [Mycolicibacterium moriokaense]BBX03468.1 hypothetical protein MMOR_44040 [Mycolicibacterium moriokaense]
MQGVGAALMLPQGLAITAAAFPNPIERGRATAGWAMAAALSTALGPILGGVLTDTVGWRYIFWLNVPIGVVALALTYRFLPESRDTDADRVDVRGQALAIFGLAALTALLVEGRTTGRVLTGTLAFAAATCLWLFVSKQRRSDHPMLPLDLFRSRALAASLVSTFTMTFGIYGLLFVNSFAFQQQRGATTLSTALWFLPMPVTYLLFIPVVNAVGQRIGPRWPITVGLVVMAAGMAVYSAAGPQGDLWVLFASFVVTGVGLAVTTGPAVTLAMSAVPVRYAGLASGVVNLARLVGITVGVAVLGTAMDAGGARIAVLTGALVQLVGAVLALRWSRTEATSTEEVCYA